MSPREFLPTPAGLELAAGTVHVWLAALDAGESRLGALRTLLTDEERGRADRFVQPQHRVHYATARGMLRELLGRALGVEPGEVAFQFNAHGKPSLAGAAAESGLRFNVSHSHGMGLFALARGRELGVDLERIRPDFAALKIAERFFSKGESARLRALPAAEQARAFFECWTRKEAYVKARGDGLTRALGSFEVGFGPGVAATVLRADDEPDAAARWSAWDLPAPEGFAGAVIVERPVDAVHCWRTE